MLQLIVTSAKGVGPGSMVLTLALEASSRLTAMLILYNKA